MNVLFVDIDGVLNSYGYKDIIVDRMVKVLGEICHKYNCKVVVESSHKPKLSEWEEESFLITKLNDYFKKYDIDCIGWTPSVEIHDNDLILPHFKDYEILYYLGKHPEIEHFAIIDDNDFYDLNVLKEYLIETKSYVSNHPEEEGLLPEHFMEVEKTLQLKNKYQYSYKIKDKRNSDV